MDKFKEICAAIGLICIMAVVTRFWGWLESLTDDYLSGVIWLAAQAVLYISPLAIFCLIYMKWEKAAKKEKDKEK